MAIAFVFDQAKSASNRIRHGIDFIHAQALWNDDTHIVIAARMGAGERFIVIGRIADKHWSAVVTHRGELVRIISVRGSREKEVRAYGSRRV